MTVEKAHRRRLSRAVVATTVDEVVPTGELEEARCGIADLSAFAKATADKQVGLLVGLQRLPALVTELTRERVLNIAKRGIGWRVRVRQAQPFRKS